MPRVYSRCSVVCVFARIIKMKFSLRFQRRRTNGISDRRASPISRLSERFQAPLAPDCCCPMPSVCQITCQSLSHCARRRRLHCSHWGRALSIHPASAGIPLANSINWLSFSNQLWLSAIEKKTNPNLISQK